MSESKHPIDYLINWGPAAIIIAILTYSFYQDFTHVDLSSECGLHDSDSMREVIASDLLVEPLWSRYGVFLQNSDQSDLMVSISHMIIMASSECDFVIAVDMETGKQVWVNINTPLNPDNKYGYGDLHQPRNLTLDEVRNRVYVSATNEIRALSLVDGTVLWSKASNNFERNSHHVIIDNTGQLTVSARGQWYIDPETGHLSETPFLLTEASKPTIDAEAEEIVAIIDNYYPISNIVSTQNHIFVLDELARFHTINKISGQDEYTIEFTEPIKTDLLYERGAIGGSWIAIEDDVIVIYFQDTNILTAYRITNK